MSADAINRRLDEHERHDAERFGQVIESLARIEANQGHGAREMADLRQTVADSVRELVNVRISDARQGEQLESFRRQLDSATAEIATPSHPPHAMARRVAKTAGLAAGVSALALAVKQLAEALIAWASR